MRYILTFWGAPMTFIWGWYFLSLYDINFGTMFFSYEFQQLVMNIYGEILGVDPASIPGLLARACILDTVLILSLYALKRRKDIKAWWLARTQPAMPASADSLDSLSSAP